MNKRIFKATVLSLLFSSCSLVSASENIKGGYELNKQLLSSRGDVQRVNYGPRAMQCPVNVNEKLENNSSVGSNIAKFTIGLGLGAAIFEVNNRLITGESFFGNLLPNGNGNEDNKNDEGYSYMNNDNPGYTFGYGSKTNNCFVLNYEPNEINSSNNSLLYDHVDDESNNGKVIDGYYYYTKKYLYSLETYNPALFKKIRNSIVKKTGEYNYSSISGYSFSKSIEDMSNENLEHCGPNFDFRIYCKWYEIYEPLKCNPNNGKEYILYDSKNPGSFEEQANEARNKLNDTEVGLNNNNISCTNCGSTDFDAAPEMIGLPFESNIGEIKPINCQEENDENDELKESVENLSCF